MVNLGIPKHKHIATTILGVVRLQHALRFITLWSWIAYILQLQ